MQELRELSKALSLWPGDEKMREALELWEKYQPESAAKYFDIVHKKGRQEGHQEGVKEVAERLIGRGHDRYGYSCGYAVVYGRDSRIEEWFVRVVETLMLGQRFGMNCRTS